MDFDRVKVAFTDLFYWDHDFFSQRLNQANSHCKQIQSELQIKVVAKTNLLEGNINKETLIQRIWFMQHHCKSQKNVILCPFP